MRKLLRKNVDRFSKALYNLRNLFTLLRNGGHEKWVQTTLPRIDLTTKIQDEKLQEQERKTEKQLKELDETRARIKFLRAQLQMYGDGKRRR